MSGVPEGRLRFFPASQSLFQKPLSWGRLPAGQSPAGWKPAPRRLLEQTLNRPSGTQSQNVPVPVPALKGWAILNCPSGTKGRTTWDALNVRISSVCPQKPILERGWGLEMKERTDLCASRGNDWRRGPSFLSRRTLSHMPPIPGPLIPAPMRLGILGVPGVCCWLRSSVAFFCQSVMVLSGKVG